MNLELRQTRKLGLTKIDIDFSNFEPRQTLKIANVETRSTKINNFKALYAEITQLIQTNTLHYTSVFILQFKIDKNLINFLKNLHQDLNLILGFNLFFENLFPIISNLYSRSFLLYH